MIGCLKGHDRIFLRDTIGYLEGHDRMWITFKKIHDCVYLKAVSHRENKKLRLGKMLF